MKQKLLHLFMVGYGVLFCFLSFACKKSPVVTLTVWGPQEEQAVLEKLVETFKSEHSGKEFDITLEICGENDAKQKVLENATNAADVFGFANDQLKDLVEAGVLHEINRASDLRYLRDTISQLAMDSATLNGKVYGYPETADNGYFLYYDSSILSADDVTDLDTMISVALARGKKIFMDVSNGWYIASFFLGNNGTLSIAKDGTAICDFNNESGLLAAQGIQAFINSGAFITGDDSVMQEGIARREIIAAVSGTWNAEIVKASLGQAYAATKLPQFTLGNGQKKQMASFGGTKILGINANSPFLAEACDLALWLINEQNQMKRFEIRSIGPSNVIASRSEAVRKNIALSALAYQSQFAYSQKNVPGSYWTPAEEFGELLESGEVENLQDALDEMVRKIVGE